MQSTGGLRVRAYPNAGVPTGGREFTSVPLGEMNSGTGQHIHWPRVLLVAALVVAVITLGAALAYSGGIEHADVREVPEDGGSATGGSGRAVLDAARTELAPLVAALSNVTVSVSPPPEPLPQSKSVAPSRFVAVGVLLTELVRVSNMSCVVPLFLGLPLRAAAVRTTAVEQPAVLFNPKIVSLGFQQSVVQESCPLWELDIVPVARPHTVRVAYATIDAERVTHEFSGTAAHCVQSAIQLFGGHTVHHA